MHPMTEKSQEKLVMKDVSVQISTLLILPTFLLKVTLLHESLTKR